MTELQAANEADKQIWMVDKQLRSRHVGEYIVFMDSHSNSSYVPCGGFDREFRSPRQRIETKFRYSSPHKQKSQQQGEVPTGVWADEDDENLTSLEELIKPTYRGPVCNVPVEPVI